VNQPSLGRCTLWHRRTRRPALSPKAKRSQARPGSAGRTGRRRASAPGRRPADHSRAAPPHRHKAYTAQTRESERERERECVCVSEENCAGSGAIKMTCTGVAPAWRRGWPFRDTPPADAHNVCALARGKEARLRSRFARSFRLRSSCGLRGEGEALFYLFMYIKIMKGGIPQQMCRSERGRGGSGVEGDPLRHKAVPNGCRRR
jgi:hypothetical protein